MTYTRVIPRDLFNEAKLLKCLGQVSMRLHEGNGIDWPLVLEHSDTDDNGFIIDQRQDDGGLFCWNMTFSLRDQVIDLYTVYNSKSNYPMWFEIEGTGTYEPLFDDDGWFSNEFVEWCNEQETRHVDV